MENKKKKVIFNEQIDSSISGFSLVCAFLIIGLFLQFNSDFFGVATNWIKILFIIIGFMGLFTEMSNLNERLEIKGFDNIAIGMVFLIPTYIMKFSIDISKWLTIFAIPYLIVMCILLFVSICLFSEGLLQIFYSIYIKIKNNKTTKKSILSRIIVVLTQLASLVLVIAQIYDIFS